MASNKPKRTDERFDDRIVTPMTQELKKKFMDIIYIERVTMASAIRKMIKSYVKRKQTKS